MNNSSINSRKESKENNKSIISSKSQKIKVAIANGSMLSIIYKIAVKSVYIIVIFLIVLLLAIMILKNTLYTDKYIDIIKENSNLTGIDPYLVLAIIKTESNFNETATSNKGAKGLMQIMDSTYEDVKATIQNNSSLYNAENIIDNIYDPSINISIGMNYLNYLIKRYNGNYYLAILAYNGGLGNVDKWISEEMIDYDLDTIFVDVPYKETKNYLTSTIISYNIYRILYR